MFISTQTDHPAALLGGAGAIALLKGAGFEAVDWSFFEMANGSGRFFDEDWRAYAQELRARLDEAGLVCNQAHAPFPSSTGEAAYDEAIVGRIVRSMEVASILGARIIVVHPLHHLPYAKNRALLFERSAAFYRALIPHCERLNIRVAAENMWQHDDKAA